MPMRPYDVKCTRPGCEQLAQFKIAARWSDGITQELKTYALCCGDCVAELFRQARAKQAACRLASGEQLDVPGIFELRRGQRDAQLSRCLELEQLLTPANTDLNDEVEFPCNGS